MLHQKPRALTVYDGFGAFPSGIRISLSRFHSPPKKKDLNTGNEDQNPGKTDKSNIPGILLRLDNERGRGNLYQMLWIGGCCVVGIFALRGLSWRNALQNNNRKNGG